jgi:hypothetical protein
MDPWVEGAPELTPEKLEPQLLSSWLSSGNSCVLRGPSGNSKEGTQLRTWEPYLWASGQAIPVESPVKRDGNCSNDHLSGSGLRTMQDPETLPTLDSTLGTLGDSNAKEFFESGI